MRVRIRNRADVALWTLAIVAVSVAVTHFYFVLVVGPALYAPLGCHPLRIAVLLGTVLGGIGCHQIMLGQNRHLALRHITDHDGLTGVLTRARFFADAGALDLSAAAVLMVDVDHFKEVNDTFGHQCGDAVLRRTARLLEASGRRGDLVARYGGEEFVICLPGTGHDEARERAERLRRAIELSAVEFEGEALSVTVSIGLAAGGPGDTLDGLIASADAALLAAKANGRNRVVSEREMANLPAGIARIRSRVRSRVR